MDNWASQFALGYIAAGQGGSGEQLSRQASARVGDLLFGDPLDRTSPQIAGLVDEINRVAAENAALRNENAALRHQNDELQQNYSALRSWADVASQKLRELMGG